jgi:4-aminobutyrate aminotransferase-like enzyme
MVAGLHMVKPGGREPDAELAGRIVDLCIEKGLLMFHPVGFGSATVKICPPLITPIDAVKEALGVLEEAIKEAL